MPFELADKPGFSEFIKKNCQFPVPTASSLSSAVLTDIYSSVKASVIQVLKNVTAATIMMDGWTDKKCAAIFRCQTEHNNQLEISHNYFSSAAC